MPSRFVDLQIRRLIVHEIFVRNEDLQPVPPRCSDTVADLTPEGLAAIRERIIKAMGSDARSLQMTIVDAAPASASHLCGRLIDANDAEFVEVSKQIAQKLASAQTARSIPGGVVVVLDGTVGLDARPFAGVIKAEVHSGFLKEDNPNGPLIRYLTDLLLTPQQKLHKIGLFIRESDPEDGELLPEDFTPYVFDSQMSGSEITTASNYFYERFLGCTAAQSARKRTRDFYNFSKEFIDTAAFADDDKIVYVNALHAYLRSNKNIILPGEFAADFLPQEVRQDYVDALEAKDLPNNAIQKDLTAIKRRLRIRKVNFTTDVRISAPADRFDELVRFEGADGGSTLVRIIGNVAHQE